MIDLRSLKFFVEVAHRQHLSRAAEALHISQPALSRQIQGVEAELGLSLFDRRGKRLVLTGAGEDLLLRATALLEQAQQLSARAAAHGRGEVGLLRIGATPQTIEALFPTVLMAFRAQFPAIETSLLEGSSKLLITQVESGASDVAIAAPMESTSDLESQELFWATLYAILPPDSALAGQAEVTVEQIAAVPLLSLRKGFLTRTLFDRACAQTGVRAHSVLESDNAHALIELARAGYGTAVVSSTALVRASGFAVPLTCMGAPIRHAVSAVWNLRRPSHPAVSAFVQELVRQLARRNFAPHLERHPASLSRWQSAGENEDKGLPLPSLSTCDDIFHFQQK
jgi:LysR family transcriptional regulator, cyn operon transcriptional activator